MPRSLRPHQRRGSARQNRIAVALVGLLGLLGAAACGSEPALDPPHGILVFALDTLRADGLSSYGNPRATSPHLDALAARGVLFEDAVSNASWTLPGFAAVLTGRHFTEQVFRGGRLSGSLVSRFRDAGYRTAAFTEGGYVSRLFGFDLGFDDYWEERGRIIASPSSDSGAVRTFGMAADWLRENGGEPFFLFVHTYETHVPYTRRRFAEDLDPGNLEPIYTLNQNLGVLAGITPAGETERSFVRALYDGGVAEVDRQVGSLLGVLDELGVADRTLVAVVSDHGEALGERDPRALGRHGHSLEESVLRVPLLLYDPRTSWPSARIGSQVRTLDLLPTLLELSGLPPERRLAGRSLVPLMRGAESGAPPAFSQLRSHEDGSLLQVAVRVPPYKLVLRNPAAGDPGELRLYDLASDPGETTNRADDLPQVRRRLHALLEKHMTGLERAGAPRRMLGGDPAMRERLRALGYLAE